MIRIINNLNLTPQYLNPIEVKNILLTLVFLITSQFLYASDVRPMPLFDYLQQDKPLEVVIKTDFSTIIDNKLSSRDYQSGIFSFKGKDSKKREIPVKVKVRGKFRLQNCEFPPLKLKFKKAELALMRLDTFNKFKLVTHCFGDELAGETFLKREFLAYQMMNKLVDNGFRTQLLKIRYVDSKSRKTTMETFGFLIEEDEQVASRMGGTIVESFNTSPDQVDRMQLAKIAMFNYMIGNADWDLKRSKNIKFVKMPDGKLCPIAYDFDFSSFVHPPYIKYGEHVLKDIHLSEAELELLKEEFRGKQDELIQLIKNFKFSSIGEKRSMRKLIEKGFEKLESVSIDLTIEHANLMKK